VSHPVIIAVGRLRRIRYGRGGHGLERCSNGALTVPLVPMHPVGLEYSNVATDCYLPTPSQTDRANPQVGNLGHTPAHGSPAT
jgi:hypothetical protein